MLLEIATFRLAAGANQDEFLAIDRRVQNEFIPNLHGFMRRTTARGDDGDWAVIVLWGSVEDAEAAEHLARDDAVMKMFMAFLDEETYRTRRFATLD